MDKLKKKRFDHIFLFENFEINFLDGRITIQEGKPYVYIHECL